MPKPGSGYLGNNKRKETDNHPDLTGSLVTPDGQEFWLNGWFKQSNDGGDEYISVSMQPKNGQRRRSDAPQQRRTGVRPGGGGQPPQQRQEPPPAPPQNAGDNPPPDDDVPF